MSTAVDYCMCHCKIHTIILKRAFVVAHKQHTVSARQLPLDRKHATLVQIQRHSGDLREDSGVKEEARAVDPLRTQVKSSFHSQLKVERLLLP